MPITLPAHTRAGKLGEIRQRDQLPAVLYGHGITNQSLALDRKKFSQVFKATGHTTLINLVIGEEGSVQEHAVLIREVQIPPVRGNILHVDFYQVRLEEDTEAAVPLVFIGTSSAVKDQGGILVRNMDEIKVAALPADLPHTIEVDISPLAAFDEPIRIKDLSVSDKVKILHEAEDVVAIVQAPRSEEELEAELAEEIKEDVSSVEGVADKPAEEVTPESQAGEEKSAEEKTEKQS